MARKFPSGIDLVSQRIVNVASPSASADAVNKSYVDNLVAGLSWKDDVRVATTAPLTLATAFENGDTIDGVVLATNDRILIKDQAAQTENGIYVVQPSGAPIRSYDADTSAELNQATVSVLDGTANTGRAFTQSTKNPTIGSSNIIWGNFFAGVTYTADGNGIELVGNQFQIELDGTTLTKSSAGIRVGSAFITSLAGNGLTESGGVLAVNPGPGITIVADAVQIDPTIVTRKFTQSIGNGALTTFNLTHGLGTQDLVVLVKAVAAPYDVVDPDIFINPGGTTVDLSFAVAPTTNQYRVTILG